MDDSRRDRYVMRTAEAKVVNTPKASKITKYANPVKANAKVIICKLNVRTRYTSGVCSHGQMNFLFFIQIY